MMETTAKLNARRRYEYQLTCLYGGTPIRPAWPTTWQRGTLGQFREAVWSLKCKIGGSDMSWRVRDPRTGEILDNWVVEDWWCERDVEEMTRDARRRGRA
jgi:hypothetical protein